MKIATKTKTANGVTFEFENEEVVEVDLGSFDQDMIVQFAIHGMTQKLGDSYASSLTVSEAVEKFYDVLRNLEAGHWNSQRSASGGIWVEAIARATGKELTECQEMWTSKDDAGKKAIKAHAKIKLAKAEITIEREQAKAKAPSNANAPALETLF